MMEEKISFVKWLGQKKSLFLKEGLFAIIFFVTFALYHLPLGGRHPLSCSLHFSR